MVRFRKQMQRPGAVAPPAVSVGRYAMYGQIGSGGMATVHLGRGPAGEVVAIKRLKPFLVAEPDVVRSFLDEARLSSRVRHPNVVATLDVVTHDDEVFLIMEYVEGVSLAFLLRARAAAGASPVPPDLAATILAAALKGLHAAHEAVSETGQPLNIVHRDVSPHNILVGLDGTVRVLDFGVAKALGRQQTTRDGRIKGKLGYMAPEQLSGRGVTRRTDVFAAGIVLWELLTGERLFLTEDEAQTVTRVLMEPVRAPSEIGGPPAAPLDRVVLRALERDPTKRFLSAEDMARAIEGATAQAPPSAVGDWVRSLAGGELARRATLLQGDPEGEIAPGLGETSRDVNVSTLPAPSPWRSKRAIVVAVGVLVFGAAAWGAAAVRRGQDTHASPILASSAAPSPVAAPSAAPVASEVAPTAPASAIELPASPASSSPAPHKPSPSRHAKGPPAKPAPSAHEHLYSRD